MVSVKAASKELSYCSIGFTALRSRKVLTFPDGGMAEYSVVNQKYLIRLPEGMDMMAAALAEPLSVADHCVNDCAKTGEGW